MASEINLADDKGRHFCWATLAFSQYYFHSLDVGITIIKQSDCVAIVFFYCECKIRNVFYPFLFLDYPTVLRIIITMNRMSI